MKFAGLRVSPECAQLLEVRAAKQGLSVGATIADVLENALVKRRQPAMPARQRRRKK
jgi:plasmid stability protein